MVHDYAAQEPKQIPTTKTMNISMIQMDLEIYSGWSYDIQIKHNICFTT
jgi:hypothetical protein